MEQLVGQRENQIVLFGGTSAGGRGSMVGFNWTRWLSYFFACPNKGGLFVYEFVEFFLDMVTIYNYNVIQYIQWLFGKHVASVTGAGGLPAGAVAPIHRGARAPRLRGVSGDALKNLWLVNKGNHQDILPFDPKYYPFGDQCHEWVNPIKGKKTSSVQRLPDVPAPVEPWMSCGSGYKIQIIPSTWALSNPTLVTFIDQESAPHRCVCGEYLLPLILTPSMVIIHQVVDFWQKKWVNINQWHHVCRMIRINWRMTSEWTQHFGPKKCVIMLSLRSGGLCNDIVPTYTLNS